MRRLRTGFSPGQPSAFITVVPGKHPLGNMGVNIPWLALCSASYLDEPGRLIPLPGPEPIRHSPYAFGYVDHTLRFQDDLRLPVSVDLEVAEELMRRSPHRHLLIRDAWLNDLRAAVVTPCPPQASKLACRYSVTKETNFYGWNLPLEFTLLVNSHKERRGYQGFKAEGVVASVVAKAKVPDFLLLPGTNLITDLRFRDDSKFLDGITYGVTNSTPRSIPATNSPAVLRAFERAVASARSDPVPGIRRRIYAVYLLVTLMFLLPGGYGIMAVWRRRRNQTTQANRSE